MSTRTTHALPAELERTRRRFERWRGTRRGHARIPEVLWGWAIEAVGRYGLSTTARTLGLDYYTLKKRVAAERRNTPVREAYGALQTRLDELSPSDMRQLLERVPPVMLGRLLTALERDSPAGSEL